MLILLLLIIFVALAWFGWTYNRLVALRNRMRAAWASIDTLLKRRADLVPNLVQAVRGYMAHEQGTLTDIASARAQALQAGGAVMVAQRTIDSAYELSVTVDQYMPRLAARVGAPRWSGLLYIRGQRPVHEAVSRRYFELLQRGHA